MASDGQVALETGKTAIFFGFQNPSPIEDDIGLIEICYQLGIRFMQLTYNNQSLLATGCYEKEDTGPTRFGKQAVQEMNRVGMVIDTSHSATHPIGPPWKPLNFRPDRLQLHMPTLIGGTPHSVAKRTKF